MKIHVVEALRFGDREKHSYVVGVYTNFPEAQEAAQAEEHWRGGKYECEIKEFELDAVDKDAMAQWEKDREFGQKGLMNFDQWYEQGCYPMEFKEAFRFIWDGAIDEAVKVVRENFEECEPWLTPEDIEKLK